MAKIGILGGTFDPIHNGHLRLGREAYEQFGLDAVWFMPTGNPPHKKIIKSLRERCVSVWLNWPLQILPISCIRILN